MDKLVIGFIGLGNIGAPIAEAYLAEGRKVTVFDINDEAMCKFSEQGVITSKSPADIAKNSDIVCVCVRDDADVDDIMFGRDGIVANIRPGSIVAIHSTTTQAGLKRWHKAVGAAGSELIDAPVSGGVQGVKTRQLVYMVGGSIKSFALCEPIFSPLASRVIHTGALGSGMALKLCNNLMTYAELGAIHEAAKLALALGLDPDLLREVGRENGVVTPQMFQFYTNRESLRTGAASRQEFEEAFRPFADLAEKDLKAALESARQMGVDLPATAFNLKYIGEVFLSGDQSE